MSSDFETVKIERAGRVAEVILNRPEAGNAFNSQLFRDVHDAFDTLDGDEECRAIVLRAEGKAFTYGLDLMAAAVDFAPVIQDGLAGVRLELRALRRSTLALHPRWSGSVCWLTACVGSPRWE